MLRMRLRDLSCSFSCVIRGENRTWGKWLGWMCFITLYDMMAKGDL